MTRFHPAVAADVQIPAFVGGNHPDIFRASAHSRVQPETAILILCGARSLYAMLEPYREPGGVLHAVATPVEPTQDFTVRSDLP